MIILTPTQANQVRGYIVKGHALAPKPFLASGASNAALNGNYGLPEACISDPTYPNFSAFLASLPTIPDNQIAQGTSAGIGQPVTGSDWDLLADAAITTYSSTWPVGNNAAVDINQQTIVFTLVPQGPIPPIIVPP